MNLRDRGTVARIVATIRMILSFRVKRKSARNPRSSKGQSKLTIERADNLSETGWGWGCVSAIESSGRTIWIADAHRDDGKRFIVRADEKLTAFLELERAVCIHLLSDQC